MLKCLVRDYLFFYGEKEQVKLLVELTRSVFVAAIAAVDGGSVIFQIQYSYSSSVGGNAQRQGLLMPGTTCGGVNYYYREYRATDSQSYVELQSLLSFFFVVEHSLLITFNTFVGNFIHINK